VLRAALEEGGRDQPGDGQMIEGEMKLAEAVAGLARAFV
jgi:hypothetical protein